MSCLALVTGAAGFVGSHVVRQLLSERYEVVGIGHDNPLTSLSSYRWLAADVEVRAMRSLECVPDLIVHCAGGASVGKSFDDTQAEYHRTVDSTSAVLEFAATTARNARLVLVSSAAVYGHVTNQPIREDEILAPVSPYGQHKLLAENMWRRHAVRENMRCSIVRLFSVYGPGLRKQLLWDACHKLTAGDAQFAGTGEESRDWLHVRDTARLLVLAGSHASTECPTVNGGYGQSIPVREVLAELSRALGTTLRPQFNGVVRVGDPDRYQADIARARVWGWAPEIEWMSGVPEYARWFLAEAV